MQALLTQIVRDRPSHMRWLATLSHLENCGAHKIVAFQPRVHVPLELLQHAAEEARHAFFFRKMLVRLGAASDAEVRLLGGGLGRRYLHLIDLKVARLLAAQGISAAEVQEGCYLLTTYVIEKRAEELYSVYEEVLRSSGSGLSLRSVLKEEEKHLAQISAAIAAKAPLAPLATSILAWEKRLFARFWATIGEELASLSCH